MDDDVELAQFHFGFMFGGVFSLVLFPVCSSLTMFSMFAGSGMPSFFLFGPAFQVSRTGNEQVCEDALH